MTVVTGTVLAVCLVAIAVMVHIGVLTGFDERVNAALEPVRTPFMLTASKWISLLGSLPLAAALLTLSGVLFWVQGHRLAVLAPLMLSITVAVSIEALKIVITRERPEPMAGIVETGFSFPSGTATIAAALFGYLALVTCGTMGRPSNQWVLVTIFALLTFAVGLSRMILSVHFLSDVVAGFILGGLCVSAVAMLVPSSGRLGSED